eukprot:5895973-Pyramimonas_sp.AAC.1
MAPLKKTPRWARSSTSTKTQQSSPAGTPGMPTQPWRATSLRRRAGGPRARGSSAREIPSATWLRLVV